MAVRETFDDQLEAAFADESIDLRPRIWVSGTVVYDRPDTYLQGQPFANWAASRLSYEIGIGSTPPDVYTGVTRVMGGSALAGVVHQPAAAESVPVHAPQS